MVENVCVIAINISEIKDATYIFVQYVVLYDGPEAYMYETKLCYVMLFDKLTSMIFVYFMNTELLSGIIGNLAKLNAFNVWEVLK